jgi:hypothetical protein
MTLPTAGRPVGCNVREREHAGTHESSARKAALKALNMNN